MSPSAFLFSLNKTPIPFHTASDTFKFNRTLFDHFVDQDGYIIQRDDFINVIASDAYRNSFAVGVILRKGWYVMSFLDDSKNLFTLQRW